MITIFPNQILKKFKHKIFSLYFLIGNEIVLLRESIINIFKLLKNNFIKIEITIDSIEKWKILFNLYKQTTFISKKKIIIIHISDIFLSKLHIQKINCLFSNIKNNELLVLHFNYYKQLQKIDYKLNYLNLNKIIIWCQKLNKNKFNNWLIEKIKDLGLKLDLETIKILLYYYEGNLLFLLNILEILKLVYPNILINKSKIFKIINDEGIFTSYQWSEEILKKNGNNAIRMLNQFKKNNHDPIILIRTLQNYLSKFIVEAKISKKNNIKHFLLKNTLIQGHELYKLIKKLTRIELNYKNNNKKLIWTDLKSLSISLN